MSQLFIGIGAQKCASTWVHRILQDHPQACVSEPKELDFFSYNFERGFQWFERHFPANSQALVRGEISPSYFHDLAAPQRLKAYCPNVRVIVTLRDPVERAYSNHLHDIRIENFSGPDLGFEAGLANNPMYVEQSRYATHLSRWMAHFSGDQLLVLLQEEIHKNPMEQSARVYRFLGIDEKHVSVSTSERSNESYLPKSRKREQLMSMLGDSARSVGLGVGVELLRKAGLIDALKKSNRQNIREIVPPMTPETRQRLEQVFADEVIALARLLGRDELPWKTWAGIQGQTVLNESR
jgi:hypothetical protein